MLIKNMLIDEVKPYEHNPKTHPKEQVEKIARSIEEFGFLVPILLDNSNQIIAGHGRLLAAHKLGLDEVPTISVDHLTESQIKAYRIADNRLTESAWDIDFLLQEVEELKLEDFDIDLTGFDDIDLGGMEQKKKAHDNTFKPGVSAITKDIEFIDDTEVALSMDADCKALFAKKSVILVSFSGGKDSTFALLWAKTNFPDMRIVAIFADTGVEFPGMVAHIVECCDFLGVEHHVVKSQKDMWEQILKKGWPSVMFHWCQSLLIYEPVDKYYKENFEPQECVIIDGSRADQVTRTGKKTKTSNPGGKQMQKYDYYHPAFDIDKKVLEHILEASNIPIWEGYARGFVRSACWMCPGMCGDQALALSENYPGLTEDIRRWERKIGKPLKQSNNRTIDDLIQTGLRNRAKRETQAMCEQTT